MRATVTVNEAQLFWIVGRIFVKYISLTSLNDVDQLTNRCYARNHTEIRDIDLNQKMCLSKADGCYKLYENVLCLFLDEEYKRKVEGGALQVTLYKLSFDHYPFHVAGEFICSIIRSTIGKYNFVCFIIRSTIGKYQFHLFYHP